MDQKAFIKLVMPFKDKVFRLAKRLLISADEAEDATQELYLKLWRDRDKIGSYRNVEAFAMTMTKNYCLDQLKSKRSGNLKLVHSNYRSRGPSLEEEVEMKDEVSLVEKMIQNLPEKQRMIIQLRDIENYEFDEIAKVMEMEPTAVRVALSRARKNIREQLIKTQQYGLG